VARCRAHLATARRIARIEGVRESVAVEQILEAVAARVPEIADELDDRLHGEFGGKRFFVESDTPATAEVEAADVRTGMYL